MQAAVSYALRNKRLLGSALFVLVLLAGFFLVARDMPALKVIAIVGAIGLFHIYFDAVRQRRSAADAEGWRKLSPGPMERFALIGSAIATAFFALIYFGSIHPDTVRQGMTLLILLGCFGIGTLVAFCACYMKQTRWNDEEIRQTAPWRADRVIPWADVVSMSQEVITQYEVITTIDGRKLRFSPYQNGADVLRSEAAVWAATLDLLYAICLTPAQPGDAIAVETAIDARLAQDGRFAVWRREGEFVLEGPSAEHVSLFVQRLRAELGHGVQAGAVHILRRATIAASVGRAATRLEGAAGAATVEVIVSPCEPSEGNVIGHELAAPLDDATEAAVLEGINAATTRGVDGAPMLGVAITVTAVACDPGAEIAIPEAARAALLAALHDATPVALEPWMKSHIDVPDDAADAVKADWRARGGNISVVRRDRARGRTILAARAPLSRLGHYRRDLRRLTGDRADAFLLFDSMERVPAARRN